MKLALARALLPALVTLGICCDRKQADAPSAAGPAVPAGPVGTSPTSEPAAPPVPSVPSAATAPTSSLPRAKDVLPGGEVSGDSLVVFGDGYRFQIKPELKPVPHPLAGTAYTGTIDGLLDPAELTLYVLHEPFAGDLGALTKRQTDAVVAVGGKVSIDGPVKIKIAGSLSDSGYRFLAIFNDNLDEQVLAVHNGTAYVFHAETPNKPNAVANVGSDLVIRGATFHVAPPEAKEASK